jgi:CRISPR/Cas system-associated exonuclease Cas4 (RecB family)
MEIEQLTHSVSSCREYELCPRRYRFAHVDREPARRLAPIAWRVGSAVHYALEAAYRHRQIHGGEGSMTDCVPAATASLHVAWEELRLTGGSSLGEAWISVRRFLDREDIRGGDIVGVEQQLAATTDDGVRVAGYADLVLRRGDEVEIRDHKVTRWERSAGDLARDFQLNLYAWLATQMWPEVRTVRGAHCYPLSGAIVGVELSAEEMERAAERVRTTATAICADSEFAPHPGEHCAHCAWAELCPEAAA